MVCRLGKLLLDKKTYAVLYRDHRFTDSKKMQELLDSKGIHYEVNSLRRENRQERRNSRPFVVAGGSFLDYLALADTLGVV